MKKLCTIMFSLILIFAVVTNAKALSFQFFGNALEKDIDGIERVVGTGSATLEFSISGNTLTVEVDNTSATTFVYADNTATFNTGGGPVTLTQGSTYDQASGIVGFGFNLLNSDTTGLDLANTPTLSAYDSSLISPNTNLFDLSLTEPWELGTTLASITLDYLPQTSGNVKGALYNPAAASSSALAATPNYFTIASLTIEFDDEPILDFTDEWSPFVRMQNVGAEGIGSLKLTPINEPATMLLFGVGLICLAGIGRNRLFKKK